MKEINQRITYREISIVLGIIGCMNAFYFESYLLSGSFVAYLMWNSFRLITHVTSKFKK